jgi:hypothetical protein
MPTPKRKSVARKPEEKSSAELLRNGPLIDAAVRRAVRAAVQAQAASRRPAGRKPRRAA